MIEKALMIASRKHGPFIPVKGLQQVSFEGLNGGDELHLVHGQRVLHRATEDGVHSVNLAEGIIRVLRIAGDSPVTVRALETAGA